MNEIHLKYNNVLDLQFNHLLVEGFLAKLVKEGYHPERLVLSKFYELEKRGEVIYHLRHGEDIPASKLNEMNKEFLEHLKSNKT